jgi:Tol biopolymer transport system component
VTSTGTQVSGDSEWPALSADGRYVAFQSSASNLVADDSNGFIDVFVHDRQSGETALVSMASGGTQGNQRSSNPTISGDGRYVAFVSYASNLVTGDTNNVGDIFVHDRQSGQTNRVSVASGGGQANDESIGPVITADGRYVAFTSDASNLVNGDTNGQDDVFVHDRQTGQTNRISLAGGGTQGNGNSSAPAISADGRYVAFSSAASNLVTGDSNGFIDIFVHDWQSGQTTLVSTAADGTQGNLTSSSPAISADGRYIAFTSSASNLVNGDTNNRADVFVYNGGP